MTKKDYIAIAQLLTAVFIDLGNKITQEDAEFIVQRFSTLFQQDNPRFDSVRFKQAIFK